jgi:DHA1 family bicyclomycin/chloramphenicol resistance-like MFS transporter
MTLLHGTLSDSFGRRSVILVSLAVYLAGSMGAGLAQTFNWLMFFRLLQGLSAGAGGVVGRAMIADRFTGTEAQRMMSYVSMVFSLAPALAPILGGWLQALFGWRSIFLFIALFAAVLLAVCWAGLTETLPKSERHAFHPRIIFGHYWQIARHGQFVLQVLASALVFAPLMIYVSAAPAFVFNILHLSATEFSWVFVPLVTGLTLGSMMAGRMSHHPDGGHRAICIGFIVLSISLAIHLVIAWFLPSRLPWAVLPIATTTFGCSLASPAMNLRSMAHFPHVRGLVSALQSFTFLLLFSVTSGVIDPLLFDSAFKLVLGGAVGAVAGLIFWGIAEAMESRAAAAVPATT